MKPWYLYLIRCANGNLYTGITLDVKRRLHQHGQSRKGAKYLQGKGPLRLVFKRRIGSRGFALSAEYWVKRLPRVKKEKLVSGNLRLKKILPAVSSV
jgi:putative endonuclease